MSSSCLSESPLSSPWPLSPSLCGCSSLTPTGCLSHAGYWPGIHLCKPQPSSVWIQSHEVCPAQLVLLLSESVFSAYNWTVWSITGVTSISWKYFISFIKDCMQYLVYIVEKGSKQRLFMEWIHLVAFVCQTLKTSYKRQVQIIVKN